MDSDGRAHGVDDEPVLALLRPWRWGLIFLTAGGAADLADAAGLDSRSVWSSREQLVLLVQNEVDGPVNFVVFTGGPRAIPPEFQIVHRGHIFTRTGTFKLHEADGKEVADLTLRPGLYVLTVAADSPSCSSSVFVVLERI